jgi:AraC-like DNA-binding protein
MSDRSDVGVLYTEHLDLRAATPLASLWSFALQARDPQRLSVTQNQHGAHEFWLERTDPLLNTILPGTHVSLIINFGDAWAAGRSLMTSRLVPRACVIGPVTQPRILRLGKSVRAIGAVVSPMSARAMLGVPASELVDQIVPLADMWSAASVRSWSDLLAGLEVREAVSAMRNAIVRRVGLGESVWDAASAATALIRLNAGNVSIEALARSARLSHRQFARRFIADTGLAPKLFTRITRFNGLVTRLLSTDVSRWASASLSAGFYDQAHMINEFRTFAGSAPTSFFKPHGDPQVTTAMRVRGRPSEWRLSRPPTKPSE